VIAGADIVAMSSESTNVGNRGRLEVRDLCVGSDDSAAVVVDQISFVVESGQVLGLVGESGSGKTTIGLALLGHCRRGLQITSGEVLLRNRNVLTASASDLRSLRGVDIAYVPQDPASALNPVLRVGTQVGETLRVHPGAVRDPKQRVPQVLHEVGISSEPDMLRRYQHQLSGGQQQRITLAKAFACRPSVIVLDEPTTGLDVTIQRHVLETVQALCSSYGVAAVYISHDLAVVGELASTVAVLYAGRIVEQGSTERVFAAPIHPYTRGLIASVPSPLRRGVVHGIVGQPPRPGERPPGCAFEPRCELRVDACAQSPPGSIQIDRRDVRCFRAEASLALTHQWRASREKARPAAAASVTATRDLGASMSTGPDPVNLRGLNSDAGGRGQSRVRESDAGAIVSDGPSRLVVRGLSASYGDREVLGHIDLEVGDHQIVAIVGESGAGKTTLAECIVGLHGHWTGEVLLGGSLLPKDARHRNRDMLRRIQYVFQNPFLSLNPRKTIYQILNDPLRYFSIRDADSAERVDAALKDVSLGGDHLDRYPDELSGGERQRVAIARALIVEPDILVCDEITSALDVSVQAVIVELLARLQNEHRLSLLFITHNLALVKSVAQSCVVISEGHVVESGPVSTVLEHPTHSYTAQLIADIPVMPWEREALATT